MDYTEYLLNTLNLAYNLDPNGTDIELMAAARTILVTLTKNVSGINEGIHLEAARFDATLAVAVLENIELLRELKSETAPMRPISFLRDEYREELRKCTFRAYKPGATDKEILTAAREIMRNRGKSQSEILDHPIHMYRIADALESIVKALAHVDSLRTRVNH